MKTSTIPVTAPDWHIVDATDLSLGRMSAKIAAMLRGKHKPAFSPHQLWGDHIVVVNVKQLNFPQKKLMQKMYYDHSGYMGHMKTSSLEQILEKNPERVVQDAVRRMLPKNRLRKEIMKRLHVFPDAEHPYAPQQPNPLTFS